MRTATGFRMAVIVALIACAGGCAAVRAVHNFYSDDRCYVPPEQYSLARDLFIQTGSLDLVHRRLDDLQWETCKVNEALYRLQKEFEVLPEDVPTSRTAAVAPSPPVPNPGNPR